MNDNPRYVILARKEGLATVDDEVVGFETNQKRAEKRVMAGREACNGYWFWMREATADDAR